LSRIAPEKGVHVALAAAKRAGLPLLVAGEVFPYPEHEYYFADRVRPALDKQRRLIGPVGLTRKRRLLSAARCLMVCSQVPETSSLVAREAIAAGTPVVALRRGALIDTVEDGKTGFLVDHEDDLSAAMLKCADIDPDACRRAARERFDARSMIRHYLETYSRLARKSLPETALELTRAL
jgi:glycosyltransferase involved in cell wall biosynthesis